ncbi:hypothetical protein ElyMa_000220800 [Elysia marginata]|uniref:PLAT domain-containing protein n=1 Tax=Elysia marginata TaxID=1093978 RepID=A0AAV4F093_9GAST|nr:hypothetical protein ElyMa_000220800 [Elysia marginata]
MEDCEAIKSVITPVRLCIFFTLVLTCMGSRLAETSLFNSEGKIRQFAGYESTVFKSSRSKFTQKQVRVKRQTAGTFVGSDLTSRDCGFVPARNASLVESVYKYFSDESSTNILEYDVTVISGGQRLNLASFSGPESYKPFRWYRTQGEGSSELLQVNHYYFGLIWPFMELGLDKVKVTINVTSPACLQNLPRGEIELLLTDYFLKDFNINPDTVEHPYVKADKVEVCHMTIRNENNWGKLTYKCCGFESDILQCRDVKEDAWVWVLRAFIMTVTILLFLYFPVILPRGYRIYDYAYYPPGGLQFNFLATTSPENYRKRQGTQILQPKDIKKMTNLRCSLAGVRPDQTYTAHVKRLDVNVGADRLLQEDYPVIDLGRSLFDTFVRCKIRHADPLEDCCKTNACGVYCLPGRPSWQAWMRAIRTVLVMAALAVPAVPFMYSQAGEGLEYQELDDAIEDRGLQRPFNFYVGKIFSKIVVGVLATMYVLHTIIIIIDGATDGNIGRLYSDVLDVSEKKGTIRKRMEKSQSCVKRALRPVQRCGVLMVPVWILALLAMPIYLILDFLFRAPMIRVFIEGFKRLLGYMRVYRRKPEDDARTVCGMIEVYLFFLSIVFVFIVLGIGANFLVHVVAMVIVKVLIDAKLVYRVLPAVLLLLLYIRDSFSRVAQKYADFLAQVMTAMRAREQDDLKRESFKPWDQQMNKIFKIFPQQIEVDPDDEVIEVKDAKPKETKDEEFSAKKKKNLFLLKNGEVRMHLGQLLLFLNKEDFLFTSKKFLFSCCTMDCTGAPGHLEDNYIKAAIDFMKIGIFLIFLFLVVMAYGNAYYISPNNQMFVTLVSGMVPLLLRNVFLKRGTLETVKVDYRFESRLEEKIAAFFQSWQIHDINLSDVHIFGAQSNMQKQISAAESEAPPSEETTKTHTLTTGAPKKSESGENESTRTLHLVLDLSDDPNFLDTPPTTQPAPALDPYSLQGNASKDSGCCCWRAKVLRFVENSVASETDDQRKPNTSKAPEHPGKPPRRRSSMNFFYDGETGHHVNTHVKDAPNDNNLHRNGQGTNTGAPLRHYNPQEARPYERAVDGGEVSPSEEHSRRNFGRWMRQSEERREALRRARNKEEREHAAHIISGLEAYMIGNAAANSMGMAGDTGSGYERHDSGVSASSVAPPPPNGDASEV